MHSLSTGDCYKYKAARRKRRKSSSLNLISFNACLFLEFLTRYLIQFHSHWTRSLLFSWTLCVDCCDRLCFPASVCILIEFRALDRSIEQWTVSGETFRSSGECPGFPETFAAEMFRSARWRSDKNRIKAVFKLQFHATQVLSFLSNSSSFFRNSY